MARPSAAHLLGPWRRDACSSVNMMDYGEIIVGTRSTTWPPPACPYNAIGRPFSCCCIVGCASPKPVLHCLLGDFCLAPSRDITCVTNPTQHLSRRSITDVFTYPHRHPKEAWVVTSTIVASLTKSSAATCRTLKRRARPTRLDQARSEGAVLEQAGGQDRSQHSTASRLGG